MSLGQLGQWRWERVLVWVGAILVGSGLLWLRLAAEPETQIKVLTTSEESEDNRTKTVTVDVSGAVAAGGVYTLPLGARVDEAITAAGGLTGECDTNWIDMYLNRSEVIEDGMKIFIPAKDLVAGSPVEEEEPAISVKVTPAKLNINAATNAQLEALPGIGPVTAGKIVAGRPYTKLEQLIENKVVTKSVWEKIKDLISLW